MDRWKYFAISHFDHVVCNPLSVEKVSELVGLLDLERGARVLDVGCGKAEFLVRLAERYGVAGVGVDLAAGWLRDARERAAARAPGSSLSFVEMDGAKYRVEPGSFDAAVCLGASWIFGGYRGTLRALARAVRPGGLVLSGEPYWIQPPDPAYVEHLGVTADTFSTHAGNVAIGVEEGLAVLYTLVSGPEDFDRYEGLQWRATERYAATHPDDPDVPDILARTRRHRDAYLRWGRDTLGWCVYLFMKP